VEKIAVIGIGRLGLCLALNLDKVGYTVTGVDVSEEYVHSLNNKTLKSSEPELEEYLTGSKNFRATTDIEEVVSSEIRFIFIVVPTPSFEDGGFDHSHIDSVINSFVTAGKQTINRHLIISSTCMPGYCDTLTKKLKGLNYTVSYNPEFIAQGSIIKDQQFPDQVLIGEGSDEAGDLIQGIYGKLCKNKPVFCRMSPISAEITKLATNCFLTTKISFANAVGDLAINAGAEPEKILKAIGADSRIGNKYFNYGFGYGGPCFPRDNKAFSKFADDTGYEMLISKATDLANETHSDFLVQDWLIRTRDEKFIEFDSVTYKKGTDILEESQQLKLAVALARAGKKVIIREKTSVVKMLMDEYGDLFTYAVNGK
jgi:UDPglucose 6-dehydrogenase